MWFWKIIHHIDILGKKNSKCEISILSSDSRYFWSLVLKKHTAEVDLVYCSWKAWVNGLGRDFLLYFTQFLTSLKVVLMNFHPQVMYREASRVAQTKKRNPPIHNSFQSSGKLCVKNCTKIKKGYSDYLSPIKLITFFLKVSILFYSLIWLGKSSIHQQYG